MLRGDLLYLNQAGKENLLQPGRQGPAGGSRSTRPGGGGGAPYAESAQNCFGA